MGTALLGWAIGSVLLIGVWSDGAPYLGIIPALIAVACTVLTFYRPDYLPELYGRFNSRMYSIPWVAKLVVPLKSIIRGVGIFSNGLIGGTAAFIGAVFAFAISIFIALGLIGLLVFGIRQIF